jgi:hypothetical protein
VDLDYLLVCPCGGVAGGIYPLAGYGGKRAPIRDLGENPLKKQFPRKCVL